MSGQHFINVKWGWTVQCECCTAQLQSWSDVGTPALDVTREAKEKGWYATYKWVKTKEGSRCRYIAYCPEHAVPAYSWAGAHREWKTSQEQVRRASLTKARSLLPEWLPKLFGYKVKEGVEEWEKTHPEPKPPWEAA